mmetsp:Transcript_2256/g.3066  ORF Transcript_2256/g.3066 Transcript_2256/m.3066 type:complete len:140 (-) Transcript_2256:238-657(-)|eukprot:CAMPEP_0201096476 /NCGR_PEP_ID=MMETSP0812-20130820/5453_1 /ASSEMBLY_ACC=CAM_ASM_000668 /TAXON_ID=98059 /ORGANISM="Dinobryon sp., Strain UTEXLB2267" /LENGTH=139 /DNA_ID=CAMNT_0047350767 /DNA_START=13 /DNA_END=432 /DNA_ORIENTATION=-
MSADALTATSRNFYEWTRAKIIISIVSASACLLLLGFCSYSGGLSNSSNEKKNAATVNDDHVKNGLGALAAGYGFASFLYFCSFVIVFAAAIFISPLCCGSNNERKVIRSPQEIDTDYVAYNNSSTRNPIGFNAHPPQV